MLDCGCPTNFPDWNDQEVDLGGRCVLTLSIPTLLHMPLAYEAYLKRSQDLINGLGLEEPWPGFVLTRTGVLRGAIIRLLNPTQSPSRHVGYLERPFNLSAHLHAGDVGTIRSSVREMQIALLDNGKLPKELYLCYLTCPRCQDNRGGPKILLLRRFNISPRLQKRTKSP